MARSSIFVVAGLGCVMRLLRVAADGDTAQVQRDKAGECSPEDPDDLTLLQRKLEVSADAGWDSSLVSPTESIALPEVSHDSVDNSSFSRSLSTQQKRIFIIRHAERYGANSCLNECGWDRARYYAEWFNEPSHHKPSIIYAFDYRASSTGSSCQRCAQTAFWVADKFKEKINFVTCKGQSDKNGKHQDEKMAKVLRTAIQEKDVSTIAVFWEHENIETLVWDLTGHHSFHWTYLDYDSYLEIYYSRDCGKKDGRFHHCRLPHRKFGFPALKRHAAATAQSCPGCKGSSRRRAGCPSTGSAQRKGNLGTYSC